MDFINEYAKGLQSRLPKVLTREWLLNEFKINKSFYIWGFTGCDLTNVTFDPELYSYKDIRLVAISTTTKLPVNHPFKYINEESIYQVDKDVQKLHEQGINGQGINVAVIDLGFSTISNEIKESLKSYKTMSTHKSNFHGSVVSSQLVGKNLGVSPKSNLSFYEYFDDNGGDRQVNDTLNALRDIIRLNEQGANIRIVNISASAHEEQAPEIYKQLKAKLESQGCYIIDSPVFGDELFTSCNFDPVNKEYYFSNWQLRAIEHYKSIDADRFQKAVDNTIVAGPSGGKMIPLGETENDYIYEGAASYSWSIPRLSGMFALALQVNPDLTFKEFVDLARETKITNEQGFNLINPTGIIEKLGYQPPKR